MAYPMTPTQEETARRRGWKRERLASGNYKWRKPKDFTEADQRMIDEAQARRERRKIGAN